MSTCPARLDRRVHPWGDSALEAARSEPIVGWLTDTAANAELVMAVCTGSILLTATGLLAGTIAEQIAIGSEYTWHDNSDWDPFADVAGLVG